jgi:hypothetical protein
MLIHKVKKLDKRYSGGDQFKYMIDLNQSRPPSDTRVWPSSFNRIDKIKEYVDIRIWAWQTWGESCEISSYIVLKKEYLWSWDSDHSNMRFYMKGDKELAWFQLKWS